MAQGKIVLIAFYDVDSFAIRTLHAVLKRAGVPVHTIFFKLTRPDNTMEPASEAEITALVEEVKRLEPLAVGLSVRSMYCQLAARVSERLRREVETCLVWGGTHVTLDPESCLPYADVLCIGEGEDALLELAMALREGRPPHQIKNLWVRLDGEVVRNAPRPLIADLDTVPFPYFLDEDTTYIDDGRAQAMPDPAGRIYYWLMSSRGCPYNCTYCCNNVLRDIYAGKGSYVRQRSVENVMQELHQARRNHPKVQFLSFMDDVFAFNANWLREFKERYKEEIGIPFFCYCYPKATREEQIAMLREAGVITMTMGIQTGSERVRKEYYHRNDTNEDIVRAAHILRKYELHCAFDVILDNPLEDERDRMETLELLLRLPRPFELHTHTLTHFPATDLTNLLLERKLIAREDVEDVKQISMRRWSSSLDAGRPSESLFWDNLYYMASRQLFPEGLVRWLSRSRLLRRWPAPLTWALRLTSDNEQTVRADSRLDHWRARMVRWLRPKWQRIRAKYRAWRG